MAGPKTHGRFLRTVERKPDVDERQATSRAHVPDRGARHSEFPVSRQGMNQESDQNKHNLPTQGAPKH